MNRLRSSSLDLAQMFVDPLRDVDPIPVEDKEEMESVVAELEFKLSNPDDWSIRAEALAEAMGYLKGGICDYEDCDFSTLALGIAGCLTDLRSALVKASSLLIIACAQTLKVRYITSAKVILPALFKPLSNGTAIIANSCHSAILSIAKNVQHRRSLSLILANSTSRTVEHRMAVAESIIVVLQNWPLAVLAPMLEEVKLVISKYIEDASATVRQTAKEARVMLGESGRSETTTKASRIPVGSSRKPRTPKIPVRSSFSSTPKNRTSQITRTKAQDSDSSPSPVKNLSKSTGKSRQRQDSTDTQTSVRRSFSKSLVRPKPSDDDTDSPSPVKNISKSGKLTLTPKYSNGPVRRSSPRRTRENNSPEKKDPVKKSKSAFYDEFSPQLNQPGRIKLTKREINGGESDKRAVTPRKSRLATPQSLRSSMSKGSPKKVAPYSPIKQVETPDHHESLPDSPTPEKKMKRCFSPVPKKKESTPKLQQTPKGTPNTVRFVENVELPDSANGGKPRSILRHSRSPTPTKQLSFEEPSPAPSSPPKPMPESPPEEPESVDIGEIMLPKTMEGAEKFQETLTRIVSSDSFEELEGYEELLPQSIISAVRFIPQFEEWEEILIVVFEKLRDIFKYDVHELIEAFKYKDEVINLAVECYTPQVLFEHFTTLASNQQDIALKFISKFFDLGYEVEISERNEKYLQRLVKSNEGNPEVEPIARQLKQEEQAPDPTAVVDALLSKIQECGDFTSELADIEKVMQCGEQKVVDAISEKLQDGLLSLIERGTDPQREHVLQVVDAASIISFAGLIEPLVNVLACDHTDIRDKIQECIAKMLTNSDCLTRILNYLNLSNDGDFEARNQAILNCVLQHLAGSTTDHLLSVITLVMNAVSPILASEAIGLRRLATLIGVEFNLRTPKEFTPFMKKLKLPQQKLIALYTSKRKH